MEEGLEAICSSVEAGVHRGDEFTSAPKVVDCKEEAGRESCGELDASWKSTHKSGRAPDGPFVNSSSRDSVRLGLVADSALLM